MIKNINHNIKCLKYLIFTVIRERESNYIGIITTDVRNSRYIYFSLMNLNAHLAARSEKSFAELYDSRDAFVTISLNSVHSKTRITMIALSRNLHIGTHAQRIMCDCHSTHHNFHVFSTIFKYIVFLAV